MQEQRPGSLRLTVRELCELALQGDQLVLRASAHLTRYVGFGLANLVTLFSPDLVSLGGGLMRSSDLFFERATALVQEVCTQVPVHKTRIVPTALPADAGLLGAAQCWLHCHPSTGPSAPHGAPA
jgi:glucokinase